MLRWLSHGSTWERRIWCWQQSDIFCGRWLWGNAPHRPRPRNFRRSTARRIAPCGDHTERGGKEVEGGAVKGDTEAEEGGELRFAQAPLKQGRVRAIEVSDLRQVLLTKSACPSGFRQHCTEC